MTHPITDEELQRLKELAERATSGPWHPNCSDDSEHTDVVYAKYLGGEPDWVCMVGRSELDQQNADTEFIAASRSAIPALIARIEEQQKEIDFWRTESDRLHSALIDTGERYEKEARDRAFLQSKYDALNEWQTRHATECATAKE